MYKQNWEKRPECSKVLEKYNEWSIDKNIVANDAHFESILNHIKSNGNKFFYDFLSTIRLKSISIQTTQANTHVNDAGDMC